MTLDFFALFSRRTAVLCFTIWVVFLFAPGGELYRTCAWAEEGGLFRFEDLEQAFQHAQQSRQLVLVHFYSPSCAPCRRMTAEVFSQPDICATTEKYFATVQIDGKQKRDLAKMFQVAAYPCDYILTPERKVLAMRKGFQSAKTYHEFLMDAVQRMDREPLQGGAQIVPVGNSQVSETDNTKTPNTAEEDAFAPGFALSTQSVPDTGNPEPEHVMLDGFCPVTMVEKHCWESGNSTLQFSYNGVQYHFATEAARTKFQANPEMYAVVLQGMDIVAFHDSHQKVAGSREFGCRYGALNFVFASEENRTKFRQNPRFYKQLIIPDKKRNIVESPKL